MWAEHECNVKGTINAIQNWNIYVSFQIYENHGDFMV